MRQHLLQGLALDELHRQVIGAVVGAAVVVHRDGVGVLQLRRHRRLEKEALLEARVARTGVAGVQHLERDEAIERALNGLVHPAMPPAPSCETISKRPLKTLPMSGSSRVDIAPPSGVSASQATTVICGATPREGTSPARDATLDPREHRSPKCRMKRDAFGLGPLFQRLLPHLVGKPN
jgi:hypothetical protein